MRKIKAERFGKQSTVFLAHIAIPLLFEKENTTFVCLIVDTRFQQVSSLSVIILADDKMNIDDLFVTRHGK